jgi:hypothetical protein
MQLPIVVQGKQQAAVKGEIFLGSASRKRL